MATTEQFSLRWNNFHSNLTAGFHDLLEASEMVDVTLAVDGHFLQAHKIVLSICSPLFKQMFKVNPCKHPIVILKDIGHDNMKDILEFMYMGEVNVLRENLSSFLRTAELLQVKGLTGDDSSDTSSRKDEKCDSLPDHDDDTDLMQLNQYIDSDLELPSHYSIPQHQQQQQQQRVTPTPSSKRGPKNQQSTNCKRTKNETNSNKNFQQQQQQQQQQQSESEMNTTKTSNDESSFIDDIKIEKNSSEPEDNVRDNSTLGVSGSNDTNANEGKPETKLPTNNINNNKILYQCQKCLKKFSRRDHLRTHEKNIHGEDAGPFVCVICSQLYKNTESLRKHIAKFHFPKMNELSNKVEVKA